MSPLSAQNANKPQQLFAWILIILGLFLLLANLGLFPWLILSLLFKLWPLILIFIGLEFVFPASSKLRPLLILAVFGLIIAVVALPLLKQQPFYPHLKQLYSQFQLSEIPQPQSLIQPQTFQSTISPSLYPEQTVNSLVVDVSLGAGRLEMSDKTKDFFFQLENHQRTAWAKPEISHQLNQGQLQISVKSLSPSTLFAPNRYSSLQLILGQPSLPTDLSLSVGAGAAQLEFNQANFKQNAFEVGAGSLTATYRSEALPKKPLEITVGAGSATLIIPQEVGIRLEYNLGLGKIVVDGNSLTGQGLYTTENYQQATTKLSLKAEVGLGQLAIERQ